MKIRVVSSWSIEEWNESKGTDKSFEELSDEEFIEVNEKYNNGWSFESMDEFVDAFNYDSNKCPTPSEHYIRVFGE